MIDVFNEATLLRFARYIPLVVLTFWATMRLLFGWFAIDVYYIDASALEDLVAIYVLYMVGTFLLSKNTTRIKKDL